MRKASQDDHVAILHVIYHPVWSLQPGTVVLIRRLLEAVANRRVPMRAAGLAVESEAPPLKSNVTYPFLRPSSVPRNLKETGAGPIL